MIVLNILYICIVKCIDANKTRVVEGELRCKELSEYLNKLNAVKSVWLSEDATRIISKVHYDVSTNQLVGLVLPLNKNNGSPIPFSFPATDAEKIQEYLKGAKSKFAYIVMAQPLDESIPPFLLQMFGTNNDFTNYDVIQRWKLIKLQLEK